MSRNGVVNWPTALAASSSSAAGAQTPHGGAQIMQRFTVGRNRQTRLTSEQFDVQRQHFGNQMIDH
ncbi:hypothetical protein A259_29795 [Pseudomonas syringae pv. actinidiae ICMP 19070]|nr:hypothetical protein A259_29795 [Pseudomonas syringae pv. actinidiae ICMP 19070]